MRRKTKNRIIGAVVAVAVVLLAGTIFGASSGVLDKLIKDRNEDNLITLESIEAAGVELGESYKSKVSDVTVAIDEDGVIKLTGTATDDDEIAYATVKLPAGTYRFSGAPDATKKTYELKMTDGTTVYRSDNADVISVSAETTFSVCVVIYEDCEFGALGEKLYPVIWEVEDSEDDTVVEFYK